MRAFQRIGLTNKTYETPLLFERRYENNTVVLLFRNFGIPISKWNDLKDNIESGLNLNIFSISERGKKWIAVKAVSGDAILPSFCEWNDHFLSDVNFELVLGKSYMGEVIVNLSVIPHMLIGGSTGSGKTILLKNLLFQAFKKGADIFIADFKGGVDFPRVWHECCTIITEQDDLINTLNDIVVELYRRRDLLVRSECANIDDYNRKYSQSLQRIIFACDEVAELLDKTGLDKEQKHRIAEIEGLIATIARLGRAFGINLVLATQRPDSTILIGQLKSNIAFRVCGRADDILSQIILDKTDANDLIPKDAQGRFLTNSDILFQGYWFDDSKL
jgi:S-DNA-T family DNA segregation ATPase FtsK/SpoIIIE